MGHHESAVQYTYEPEVVFEVLLEIRSVYRRVLKMDVYAMLAQGSNEYYDDALLHISSNRKLCFT